MAKKSKQITQAGATEILPGQQNPTIILQSPPKREDASRDAANCRK